MKLKEPLAKFQVFVKIESVMSERVKKVGFESSFVNDNIATDVL